MAKMDEELKAITAVERAIKDLSDPAQVRVLRLATERLNERLSAPAKLHPDTVALLQQGTAYADSPGKIISEAQRRAGMIAEANAE